MGVAVADYDNDGDEDILLTTLQKNKLFRNDKGVFREVSKKAGIAGPSRWSTSAMFFDANRDGHLDLYIANYVEWSTENILRCVNEDKRDYCHPENYSGLEDAYYQNDGDGTFTNRTKESELLDSINVDDAKGLGVASLELNYDGWTDIYIANDGTRNFLYENNGGGSFEEVAIRSGVAFNRRGTPRAGMGIDVGVVDSTGEPTIFVGNFTGETVSVWRHEGKGLFTDRTNTSKVGFPTLKTLTFGTVLFDVDLDTDLDLLLANGHVLEQIAKMEKGATFRERPQLFLNQGDGMFKEVAAQSGPMTDSMLARGLAVGDVNRDGDLDVLVTENDGPAHLWRNNQAGGNFLRVSLQGTESNRDGIGAKIRASVSGLTIERRVRTGRSYLSQSEKTVTFGLGDHCNVSTLEVTWPSGEVEKFRTVSSNQEVRLKEGTGELKTIWERDSGCS
jgi:hypothetical protein